MEFGIGPLTLANMAVSLLASIGVILRDTGNVRSRSLYANAERLISLAITAYRAAWGIATGRYGAFEDLGWFCASALFAQLFVAGVSLSLLDDLIAEWGVQVSGVNLFIAVQTCQQVVWRLFSLQSFQFNRGTEYEGAITALVVMMWKRPNKWSAFTEVMFRAHLPNLLGLIGTGATFLGIIVLDQMKISVGLVPADSRRGTTAFDIPLFYTSTMPLIFQQIALEFVSSLSQHLWQAYPGAVVTKIVGVWASVDTSGGQGSQLVPISGLAYYLAQPLSIRHILADPLQALVFLIVTIVSAGYLALLVLELQGPGPAQVARELKMQRLKLPGHREDENGVEKRLARDIPMVSVLGGVLLRVLAFGADMLGTFGSGSSILIAASVINRAKQSLLKECRSLGKVVPAWLE
jgi:protein transport protein SEC61 subunit alpha